MSLLSVVSLQSSVLMGMVGNNVARRVYHSMGIPAYYLDTVCFSNVASKKSFGLTYQTDEWLDFYQNALQLFFTEKKCDILQTGYFGCKEQIVLLRDFLAQCSRQPLVVVDPVIGDNGKIYVSQSVCENIRELLPYTNILIPNLFEFEYLSQKMGGGNSSIIKSAQKLFAAYKQLRAIIITSAPSTDQKVSNYWLAREECPCKVSIQRSIGVNYGGTGDLFSALFCSYLAQSKSFFAALKMAVSQSASVIAKEHKCQKIILDIPNIIPLGDELEVTVEYLS